MRQDTFVARQRVFADGQSEITISKEKYFIGREMLALPRSKRGESKSVNVMMRLRVVEPKRMCVCAAKKFVLIE